MEISEGNAEVLGLARHGNDPPGVSLRQETGEIGVPGHPGRTAASYQGHHDMTKFWLIGVMAFAMTTGVAFAQSSETETITHDSGSVGITTGSG